VRKLKIESVADEKPVKLNVELSASVHRDLKAYAQLIEREGGGPVSDPAKLVDPMLSRFMATDRAFARARKAEKAGQILLKS
jgi:hypothetical protein